MNQLSAGQADTSFFGHPKGLQTLFLTEMWERMSYYGMRGILVLFMTAALQDGGLGFVEASAFAIYGLYTASVYFMGLPGGWIADRLIGSQKAIWYGGIVIMLGHIVLAIPNDHTFFIAGYAIYYMGINIGSFIGYTVCGYLEANVGYHWAFGAAAVGMGFGLIQYKLTQDKLIGVGTTPTDAMSDAANKRSWTIIFSFLVALSVIIGVIMTGLLTVNPIALAKYTAVVFTATFFLYFFSIYMFGNLTEIEKKGMWALMLVCVASACFWSGFEQAGSSLNIFARDFTDRMVGTFEIPTAWFQNANPFFIIVLTPLFAAMWINLGKRLVTPAYGIKCAVGLMIMASGFIVMFFAAQIAAGGGKAPAFLLIMTYFLHTVGELCLSPISLSAVSKLSPRRYIGQMMGVFVLTYSIGNIIAGLLAGGFDSNNVAEMPNLFLQIVTFSVGIGAVILLVGMFTKGWEKQVEDSNA